MTKKAQAKCNVCAHQVYITYDKSECTLIGILPRFNQPVPTWASEFINCHCLRSGAEWDSNKTHETNTSWQGHPLTAGQPWHLCVCVGLEILDSLEQPAAICTVLICWPLCSLFSQCAKLLQIKRTFWASSLLIYFLLFGRKSLLLPLQ